MIFTDDIFSSFSTFKSLNPWGVNVVRSLFVIVISPQEIAGN
ncbi:hypothetical protein HMPREF0083_05559 [Aneurinibacillus aneurinilyticus ATCC 12856]|uniref:Uncharacterized protein n=1 Tax=Aneurinibacillus aneurinilyticus ATCC 12856 TaxID=649747 RepID=U1Y0F7_ANEAE|nr:hypothetical protein HMPREF0083_05559 [Aneurinibacillus aneurinilyticus ATCC 12856]